MKHISEYIIESQNKNLQNAFDVLKKFFRVNPEFSKDGRYVYVKLESKRTYQFISIYEEDNDHVMIDTGIYEDAYVVPNTTKDIETFLKSYKNGTVSDNAIEVQKYRKSK